MAEKKLFTRPFMAENQFRYGAVIKNADGFSNSLALMIQSYYLPR
jgi:hypothetical protein